jgi:hypothetical protein
MNSAGEQTPRPRCSSHRVGWKEFVRCLRKDGECLVAPGHSLVALKESHRDAVAQRQYHDVFLQSITSIFQLADK